MLEEEKKNEEPKAEEPKAEEPKWQKSFGRTNKHGFDGEPRFTWTY